MASQKGRPPKVTIEKMLGATAQGLTRSQAAVWIGASYNAISRACVEMKERGILLASESKSPEERLARAIADIKAMLEAIK